MSITLYSTGCPRCCVLKKKLKESNISYAEENSVERMLTIGISQVPVLEVDGVKMDFTAAVEWIKEQ